MPLSVRKPAEHVPPVRDDRGEARGRARRLELARDEPAPPPLVLVLVEVVFAVPPVPVELRQRGWIQFRVVCDEREEVPPPPIGVLYELELLLRRDDRVLFRPPPCASREVVP